MRIHTSGPTVVGPDVGLALWAWLLIERFIHMY